MKTGLKRFARSVAVLALVAVSCGLLFSRLYWGYWVQPPSIAPWLSELHSVDARGFVVCEPDAGARVQEISDSALQQGAAAYRASQADNPGYQLLEALAAARLPVVRTVLPDSDATRLCQALFASGIVLNGDSGYQYARFVRGFAVSGRTGRGERVWIWSAIGGEVSNDHHPVYDLQFSEAGVLTKSHRYFEDIAGIEGVRWHAVSIVMFVAGAFILALIFSVVVTGRFVVKRLRRFTARGPLVS